MHTQLLNLGFRFDSKKNVYVNEDVSVIIEDNKIYLYPQMLEVTLDELVELLLRD